VARDMSRNPLFDVMFAYQKGDEHSLDIRGLSFTAEDFSTGISKFDITLNVIDGEAKICFSLEYCTDLFSHDTILRMARHFENIAGQVLKNPAAALSQIETVLPEEKQQLLHEFNPLPVSYPENETVLDLLKRQANTFPSHIAVRCKDEELTYAELDSRSGRLAALLHEKGAGPESIVGILLDRSTDMIVAIWAVLKAGAAYVPIDSSYPPERIGYLLSDSGAQALLTHSAYAGRNDYSGTLILIDACETSACSPDFCAQVKGSQLAYVVYTSGSTGNPKGVMIEHSSLHDYVHTFIRYFSLSSADTVLYQTSVSFDTTMEAIFPVLCVGGKLVIHKNNRDLSAIPRLIKENGVTLLSTTPIVIDYLNSHSADLSPLRALLSGGEVLKPAHIDRLIGQMEIFNGYGPSESTVCTSFHKVEKLVPNISIGRPIANRQVYILNGHNSLQPVGVVGELCIGGPGLARGYLNQPALTGKKFPPNPFMPGTRMYKTGDLARWLPDGTLEFTGRKDNQVKIRGFRVELGEIEKTLLRHPGIHEALVVATEVRKNETDLVAYVVTRQEIAGADIRAHLENLLPNYMIPSYFVIMDNIPLTTNGKTDYKALPLPDPEGNRSVEFIEPATETEKNLAGIWKEVLGLSKVGIHDNFFQLGGNSLKIIRLLKLIDNLYPDMVKVNDLFDFATISQLANVIKERTSPGSSGMETPAAKPQKVKF
jgi:amino acid adenylation domain-containing protein